MAEIIAKIVELIKKAKNVLIIIHEDPDGDTIASSLALAYALEQLKINVKVVGKDPVPAVFKFLPGQAKITHDYLAGDHDLIIVLDCGDLKRTGFPDRLAEFARTRRKLINIDHHRKSDLHKIANINFFDEHAAATAEMVYQLILALGANITPPIATNLLCGIYTDTGGFRHSNTSPETLEIASLLMERGAKLKDITKNLNNQKKITALKLWGMALAKLHHNRTLNLVSSVITRDDLSAANAGSDDLAGLVNLINTTAGAKLAILLAQVDENTIKVSLRTEALDVDVSKIAEIFGGGGHKKAAGFIMPGKIVETKSGWKVELLDKPL